MKRFALIKESLLATIMTLIITFGVSFIPFKNEFTKGIKQGFLGFDIYDLYFSGNHLKNTQRDTNIIIVEVESHRSTIADQITLLQKYSPAVIGIDVVFEKHGDTTGNHKLLKAITHSDNIVFSSIFNLDAATSEPGFENNFFEKDTSHFTNGYINFLGNEFSVIRNYPPFLKLGDSVYLAFSSSIVKKFLPEKFNKLKKRKNNVEIINYIGNLESYTSISKEQLKYWDADGQLTGKLTNKIVLLGIFVKDQPLLLDDLHFSPLNEQVAGKSFPDMYGVVIHANIISMILSANYMKQASELMSSLIAGLIVFLFLLFILSRYKKQKHPKHGWFLVLQFFIIMVMLYLFLQIFNWFHIKFSLLPTMIALVLCVELLGVYKTIALWLNKKYQYNTVFNKPGI